MATYKEPIKSLFESLDLKVSAINVNSKLAQPRKINGDYIINDD